MPGPAMPMYQFRFSDSPRSTDVEEIGFFNDDGAMRYAGRIGAGRAVQVWRGSELVGESLPAEARPSVVAS